MERWGEPLSSASFLSCICNLKAYEREIAHACPVVKLPLTCIPGCVQQPYADHYQTVLRAGYDH